MKRGYWLHAAALLIALWASSAAEGAETAVASADGIDGRWSGETRAAGIVLPMSVTFSDGGTSATIDIQGVTGLGLQGVAVEGDRVRFELAAGPGLARWDGTRTGDAISGTFSQGGATGEFELARGDRPETPEDADASDDEDPRESEATFSRDDLTFAGTLTVPEGDGPWPAVVFVSGSGAQDRDETLYGFKPFRILSRALADRGIASLRYDDRGVGGSSPGPANATSEDLARDALAAVRWLAARDQIDGERVGILGHSEGGMIGPWVSWKHPDAVAFLVLLAPPAVDGETVLRTQAEAAIRASGGGEAAIGAVRARQTSLFEAVRSGEGWDALVDRAVAEAEAQWEAMPESSRPERETYARQVREMAEGQIAGARSAWYRFFVDYDPRPALKAAAAAGIPVLAVFGEKDLQVLPDVNRPELEAAFASGGRATVWTIASANHLFQHASSGLASEYATLPDAFTEDFVERVVAWTHEAVAPPKEAAAQ